MWISVKAFMALEARDLVSSPNSMSGIAAESQTQSETWWVNYRIWMVVTLTVVTALLLGFQLTQY